MSIEIQGLTGLTRDLEQAALAASPAVRAVTEANGKALEEAWRANARRTAGKHGRWYPSSITSEERLTFAGATAEVGPDTSRRQGKMGRGFEYGSVNQPPHLDGTKAAEVIEPKYLAEIEAVAAGLL